MINPNKLIADGVAKAAASMFPTEVFWNDGGTSPSRFVLALDPEPENPDEPWVAMAWKVSQVNGEPLQILGARVQRIVEFGTSRVFLQTATMGNVIVRPSGGGCCGNKLRSWNPFGSDVTLVAVDRPVVEPLTE